MQFFVFCRHCNCFTVHVVDLSINSLVYLMGKLFRDFCISESICGFVIQFTTRVISRTFFWKIRELNIENSEYAHIRHTKHKPNIKCKAKIDAIVSLMFVIDKTHLCHS